MGRTKEILVSPGAFAFRLFLLFSFLFFGVPWLYTAWTMDGDVLYRTTPSRCYSTLRSIRQRLEAGNDVRMQRVFPEGQLFCHSFYGFTLVSIALANPGDAGFQREAITELERIIPIVESLGNRPPYSMSAQLTPRGGVILASHLNRLRAGYALLGGKSEAIIAAYHRDSQILHDAYLKSPTGNLESYPGSIWPVDNLMALDSLRIHDSLYGTEYSDACAQWASWMKEHVDATTGMMPSQISLKGQIIDGPRGCALSWSLAVLPSVDPDMARQQYDRYREWIVAGAGLAGYRERPVGDTVRADADSGPVIAGVGMGASGLGVAAAKANNDPESLTGLLRLLVLGTFPSYSPPAFTRSHFAGQVLLVDAIALWGETLTPWNMPVPLRIASGLGSGFWKIGLPLTVLVLVITAFWERSTWRMYRRLRDRSGRWHRLEHVVLYLQLTGIAAWLAVPAVPWAIAIVGMWLARVAERLVVKENTRAGEQATHDT
jgi:hypothetical protein